MAGVVQGSRLSVVVLSVQERAASMAAWAEAYVRQAPAKAARVAAERDGDANPELAAAALAIFAALDGAVRCRRCGRRLRDKTSVARRIGPECVEKERAAERADEDAGAARRCRVCGCTDAWGCDGGCSWVDADLCSACVAAGVLS